jgi:hypothetical protein
MTNLDETTRADLPALLQRAGECSLHVARIEAEQAELRRAYVVDAVHTSAAYRSTLDADRARTKVELLQLQHRIGFLKKLERQARAKQNLAVLETMLTERGLADLVEEARRRCIEGQAA